MRETENKTEFFNAAMDTPFNAICVKKRGKDLRELCDERHSHGILVNPYVGRGPAATAVLDQTMQSAKSHDLTVTVRGHGWGVPGDKFVWMGTAGEFSETWEID